MNRSSIEGCLIEIILFTSLVASRMLAHDFTHVPLIYTCLHMLHPFEIRLVHGSEVWWSRIAHFGTRLGFLSELMFTNNILASLSSWVSEECNHA